MRLDKVAVGQADPVDPEDAKRDFCCQASGKRMAYAQSHPANNLVATLRGSKDGSKDVVTWQCCIFDLEVPGALLQESFRVLRPGGRLECCSLPTAAPVASISNAWWPLPGRTHAPRRRPGLIPCAPASAAA